MINTLSNNKSEKFLKGMMKVFKWIYKWTDKVKEKVATLSDKMSEKGQGITEYAMILAAVAIIAAIVLFGTGNGSLQKAISDAFTNASTKIDSVTKHQ